MFDTLVAYKKCKKCSMAHRYEIQFKIKDSIMNRYYIGDKTRFKEGVYRGVYFDYHSDNKDRIKDVAVIVHEGGIISIQDPFYTREKFYKKG